MARRDQQLQIPAPAPAAPGSMDYRRELALAMSQAIKQSVYDRIDVAARMSRFLGEEITVSMLNAWTAESRDLHIINFVRAIAFDRATEQHTLASLFAAKLGGQILWGKDALLAELVRLDREERELKARRQSINSVLREANK
jgi:hypothetical protein